ncbi:hypothetical protein [Halobacillus dabanensis]|nr:hypothetical protein [Halobacillus dabanensis]
MPANASKDTICNVKSEVKDILQNIQFEHVTIQVEYEDEKCSLDQ